MGAENILFLHIRVVLFKNRTRYLIMITYRFVLKKVSPVRLNFLRKNK